MLILVLLASFISFRVSAIIVNPGTYFSVGNETYTVYQTMDFESITIDLSYIVFNNTGFYVTSGNDITISLIYLNDDIAGDADGEKVLGFYADTTSGNVVFDLSGFPVGNDYLVKRSGSPIDVSTANGSGFISFINSVWDNHLFEITKWEGGTGNNSPVVSDIPDQTILEGAIFTQIDLDNYVFDLEDPDENISWSYSGNTELIMSIVNRVATISTPHPNWYGAETITFTAEDTDGLTDSDDATFTVNAQEAPVFSDLSINDGATEVSISTSSLSIIIEDPNGDSFDWAIETSPNIGSNSGSNDSNGSKSCSISGLAYSKTYIWFVNATDGNYWNNASCSFTTEASPPNDSPGGGGYIFPVVDDGNIAPETPVKPSGPTFVEIGVEYAYASPAVDVDGDQIRYQFDWGDGNFSGWSEFAASNTSVSMSHSWTLISNYGVRVMTQDENGLNSSWSLPLNVTVSQSSSGGDHPVADIAIPGNLSANQTIIFDGSGSFDEDGTIVSYCWDFGDGENGSGMTPSHIYGRPGNYAVTLVITDDNDNTYSKSIMVTVTNIKTNSKNKQGVIIFRLDIYILGGIMAILLWLAVFLKGKNKSS